MATQGKPPHVVFVPTPGMGHLIPMVQLAHRLIQAHNFTVSFVIPTEGPPSTAQKAALASLPEAQSDSFFLPPISLDDLEPGFKIETGISLTLARSVPALRTRLSELSGSHNLKILIVDLFGTDAFDVCHEFGLKPYIFYVSTAMCLSLFFHLPQLDGAVSGEYKDMVDPVRLPGSTPVHGRDLLEPVQERTNDAYKWVLHHAKRYPMAEGILVNTFNELEEGTLKGLQQLGPGKPPVYPVGPLVQSGSGKGAEKHECLKWLDEQPRGSVLFVSFGSGGTLSYDQINELAHGLEMSEQRFLWAVRAPNDKIANATYFSSQQGDNDTLAFLPKGFLERTRGRGLVIPSWAPQIEVLSHESTGGFLTHCGWNSILEGVVYGVPFIAWPLYAEQNMNAVMLTEGLKVALRPMVNEAGLVGRGEIAMAVKGLMEGEKGKEIRNKMKGLKEAAAKVLSEDGSSTKALREVTLKWRSY